MLLAFAIGWIPGVGWAVGGLLALAVFVLAIVGMGQGNIGGGVRLILFAVLVPLIVAVLALGIGVCLLPSLGTI